MTYPVKQDETSPLRSDVSSESTSDSSSVVPNHDKSPDKLDLMMVIIMKFSKDLDDLGL